MELELNKKPKNPTIIEGFPGFGLIGTITTEFLIDHLKTEQIGKIKINELPAMVAIHDNNVVEPVGLFYNKKYNIVIVHGIVAVKGIEWELAELIAKLAKDLNAKEVISLEGVSSATPDKEQKVFFYSSKDTNAKKFEKIGLKKLKEGIIMGVTGALLVRNRKICSSALFADTQSNLPDSKASAKIIEIIDKYLNLKVDYKPLLEQAEKFESKLKDIMEKSKVAAAEQDKKRESYIG